MAINYTISFTFSPNTTISSSQVNTNFSDNANTWTGLEAETKSFAKLKVDVTPTSANEVAIKTYVDRLNGYRRPVLQYSSGTVVNVETGLNGTSGAATVLFPDGDLRTDSTSGRINCNLAQVAALSGTAQSGLQTGTVANNTWYAIYAVKTTDNTSNFVTVATTAFPVQANYATIAGAFGSTSFVYLGAVRNGDNSGSATGILAFTQSGNFIAFNNSAVGTIVSSPGLELSTTVSSGSGTWAYSSGTGAAQVPPNVFNAVISIGMNNTTASASWRIENNSDVATNHRITTLPVGTGTQILGGLTMNIANGFGGAASSGNSSWNLFLNAYWDPALGIGANPLL